MPVPNGGATQTWTWPNGFAMYRRSPRGEAFAAVAVGGAGASSYSGSFYNAYQWNAYFLNTFNEPSPYRLMPDNKSRHADDLGEEPKEPIISPSERPIAKSASKKGELTQAERETRQREAADYLERAHKNEAEGKLVLAKFYYQQAAYRSSPSERRELLAIASGLGKKNQSKNAKPAQP